MARNINLLDDVMGILTGAKDTYKGKNKLPRQRYKTPFDRTIKGKASNYVLQFPLVASTAVDSETVELMRNQLELERAFEFSYVLTNSPIIRYDMSDPDSFLGDYHNNINFNESKMSDILASNEYYLQTNEDLVSKLSVNEMSMTKTELDALNEGTAELSRTIDINGKRYDVTLLLLIDGGAFKEFTSLNRKKLEITIDARGKVHDIDNSGSKVKTSPYNDTFIKVLENKTGDRNGMKAALGEMKEYLTKGDNKFIFAGLDLYNAAESIFSSYMGEINSVVDYERGTRTEVDTNKLNSSLPTVVTTEMDMLAKDGNGIAQGTMVKKPIKFGVKTVVHSVSSEDIVFYLTDNTRKSNLVTKLIKFTTGEVKLFRDLLFDTERVKKIARDSKKGRSGAIWNKLNTVYNSERLKFYSGAKANKNIPTTSLMVSLDEVEEIRRKTGVDILTDKRASDKIYKEFFLLELLVIDTAREVLYKYLPEHSKFEVVKLDKLGAKKVNDNSKKDMDSKILERLLKRG